MGHVPRFMAILIGNMMMECGFGIYCTIFADTPVCMGQKSTKSQGGTRYLWKKRRGSIKISVLVHQKLLPPEPTSVFRTHFWSFLQCVPVVFSVLCPGEFHGLFVILTADAKRSHETIHGLLG